MGKALLLDSSPEASHKSYLNKKGQGKSLFGRANWKKRWIVLEKGVLSYFENEFVQENGFHPFGTIRLSKQDRVEFCEEENDKRVWTFQLVTPNRTLILCASFEDERQNWVDWIREHIKIYGK